MIVSLSLDNEEYKLDVNFNNEDIEEDRISPIYHKYIENRLNFSKVQPLKKKSIKIEKFPPSLNSAREIERLGGSTGARLVLINGVKYVWKEGNKRECHKLNCF